MRPPFRRALRHAPPPFPLLLPTVPYPSQRPISDGWGDSSHFLTFLLIIGASAWRSSAIPADYRRFIRSEGGGKGGRGGGRAPSTRVDPSGSPPTLGLEDGSRCLALDFSAGRDLVGATRRGWEGVGGGEEERGGEMKPWWRYSFQMSRKWATTKQKRKSLVNLPPLSFISIPPSFIHPFLFIGPLGFDPRRMDHVWHLIAA